MTARRRGKMRIILMGQQAFGKSVAEKLHTETEHEIVAIYCEPDKDNCKDFDPVKKFAIDYNLPLIQTSSLLDLQIIDSLRSLDSDLCVMAYVTMFSPKTVRNIPRHGSICFHPSLLPLHRGPSSINWPIIAGAKKTGVTVFYPDDGLDEGDILLQKEVDIGANETLGELYFNKLFPLGVQTCIEAVDLIANGNAPRTPQNHKNKTYQSWCNKENARIDWKKNGDEIYNLIRGCNPKPGAWSTHTSERLTFLDTKFVRTDLKHNLSPGQIIEVRDGSINVAVTGGYLSVSRVQLHNDEKKYIQELSKENFPQGSAFE